MVLHNNVQGRLDRVADVLHAVLAERNGRDGLIHSKLGRSAKSLSHLGFGGAVVRVLATVEAALGRAVLVLGLATMTDKTFRLKRILATESGCRGENLSYGPKALDTAYLTTLIRVFAGVKVGVVSQVSLIFISLVAFGPGTTVRALVGVGFMMLCEILFALKALS